MYSVQHQTEVSCFESQNTSILSADDYPPFNPSSTFKNPPHAPTFPSQPSFSSLTSWSPQPDWDDNISARFPTPDHPPSSLPPFASEQTSPSDDFVQGSSSGSGRQEVQPLSGDSQSAMSSGYHVFQLELVTSPPTKSFQPRRKRKTNGVIKKKQEHYYCNYPGCSAKFPDLRSRNRHLKATHQPPDPEAKCQRCGRQMSRPDALRRHERLVCNGLYVVE